MTEEIGHSEYTSSLILPCGDVGKNRSQRECINSLILLYGADAKIGHRAYRNSSILLYGAVAVQNFVAVTWSNSCQLLRSLLSGEWA